MPSPFSGPLTSMPQPGAGASRADALLDAAEAVIVRDGLSSLTLDAVAAEAKVSKGGLLHHFRTKDHLIEALVKRTAEAIRSHNAEACAAAPEGPGRMARGLLEANLRDMHEWCVACQRGSAATFSALAHDPRLLAPMRETYAELLGQVERDRLPEGVGEVVVAALDGLWLYWVLGLVQVDQAMIARMRKALRKIVADATPAEAPRAKDAGPAKSAKSAASAKSPKPAGPAVSPRAPARKRSTAPRKRS